MIPANSQQLENLGFIPDVTEQYLHKGREYVYQTPYTDAIIYDSDRKSRDSTVMNFVSVGHFLKYYEHGKG